MTRLWSWPWSALCCFPTRVSGVYGHRFHLSGCVSYYFPFSFGSSAAQVHALGRTRSVLHSSILLLRYTSRTSGTHSVTSAASAAHRPLHSVNKIRLEFQKLSPSQVLKFLLLCASLISLVCLVACLAQGGRLHRALGGLESQDHQGGAAVRFGGALGHDGRG